MGTVLNKVEKVTTSKVPDIYAMSSPLQYLLGMFRMPPKSSSGCHNGSDCC